MVTKFSEKFAISMLKKHKKFVGVASFIWMPLPFFKNRSDTYETPCTIKEFELLAKDWQCSGNQKILKKV
jgi:hypothetical protein